MIIISHVAIYYDIDITTFVVDILEVAFSLLSPGQGAIQKEKRKKFVEDDECELFECFQR